MYALNLEQRTNSSMAVAVSLSLWADLYDLSAGHFHMQMREHTASAIVLYEWSTEENDIVYTDTKANGWIEFTNNPAELSTIRLGTSDVTFVVTPATDGVNEVALGEDITETLANLVDVLNNSLDEQISLCTYGVASSNTLVITFGTAGTLGNSYAIDSDVGGTTRSGDVLSGGGGMLLITAPVDEIETFSGEYFYDCRFQLPVTSETIYVVLFGGVLTFVQGVTRDTET